MSKKKKLNKRKANRLDLDLQSDVSHITIAPRTSVQEQLAKNIEILKGLEDEFVQSQAERKQRSEVLEAEGHHTLEEKIKAMQDKIITEQKGQSS